MNGKQRKAPVSGSRNEQMKHSKNGRKRRARRREAVTVAGALLLSFLAYGYRSDYYGYKGGYIPKTEAVAEIVYIAVAVAGIFVAGNFCLNQVLSYHWHIETAQIMSDAVGVNVFTGISCLLIAMLGTLVRDNDEEGSELK